MQLPSSLVSVEWLHENIDQPQLVILDASWHMPAENRNGHEEFLDKRIAGARFFDFDGRVCDQDSSLPHMLPSADLFTTEARRLGINQDSLIVVYDSFGIRSSARVWWMFRAMGHQDVAVLDGGLPAWLEAGHACNSGELELAESGDFVADLQPELVKDKLQVQASIHSSRATVVDARSQGRFEATAPEPRPELRGGHIPGSSCLPFELLVGDGHMIAQSKLELLFDERVEGDQQMIFSCGSGVTAAILALGAELIGRTDYAVYDGSWSEWGLPELELPIDP